MVRRRREPAGAGICGDLDDLARDPRHQGQSGRGRAPPFGFLTTEANAFVAPVHPKAMPVILRTEEECETWMTAPAQEALQLQRRCLTMRL